ncbi:MAG: penicillin acylase family protein [Bacteroidetes bacterium]|nr:MAG: penicillin acylase family protein [Bacteroidota bacterium]
MLAYLDGVNTFIAEGNAPPEFALTGIPMDSFTVVNTYDVMGYMAFSFAAGFRNDPVFERIGRNFGRAYLADIALQYEGETVIPRYPAEGLDTLPPGGIAARVQRVLDRMPVSPLIGSNAWVLGPRRTASGKVLFANDPHIAYSQPSVWYEAHLETPDWHFYGYHLAGHPFAPIGHCRDYAVGMTMFENDDVNYYRETFYPEDSSLVLGPTGHAEPVRSIKSRIAIKGEADTVITIRRTPRGPLMDVFPGEAPASAWWTYLARPGDLLQAAYRLAHLDGMAAGREAVALVGAPGLNIMYGDAEGNVAWWVAAALVDLPDTVNTFGLLDATNPAHQPDRFLPFAQNPQAENPPAGYVYSANNYPAAYKGRAHYPGYYAPDNRARRINEILDPRRDWTLADMQAMAIDDQSPVALDYLGMMLPALADGLSGRLAQARDSLAAWDGRHQAKSVGPTLYHSWMRKLLAALLQDEMGAEDYDAVKSDFIIKRSMPMLLARAESPWWDDVTTTETVETQADILRASFEAAIAGLEADWGDDLISWRWERVHTLTHPHAFGRQGGMLGDIFNVGPLPIAGGEEVINNISFSYSEGKGFPATFGPSRRAVIDFSDVEHSYSILPTGQSGHLLSPYYDDQAAMYQRGEYRLQLLDRTEIEAASADQVLWLRRD